MTRYCFWKSIFRSLLVIAVSAVAFPVLTMAQDVKFTVEVSSDSVLMNHRFSVAYTLENSEVERFTPPSFNDFEVLSGPATTSRMQFSNGVKSNSISYEFVLRPILPGAYQLPTIEIATKDGLLVSESLEIMVYPNPDDLPEPPQKQSRDLFDDFFLFPEFDLAPQPQPGEPKPKTYRL